MDNETVRVLLIVVISYLLGSIPSAYIIGRLHKVNIFKVGSGNMGATNVIRATGGIGWGMLVWFFDSVKGIIAMLLAARLMPGNPIGASLIAGVVAIVGHNWSLFAAIVTGTLRGGKGAATAFGTLLLIVPLHVIAAMLAVCGVVIALTRYVSLGVLLMFGVGIAWLFLMITQRALPFEYLFYTLSITALILIRFRENIQRIIAGTERRLGERT
jgi:glycerol-3-phosphate acyltransferase PlsY